MCFAPQRHGLFRHLNFQKWSEDAVFCTFSLPNVLRATTACNFYFLICRDVSAPAALASLLFNRPEPQNIGKQQCFATSLPFRAAASSPFLIFSTSELLPSCSAFPSVHIVVSLAQTSFDEHGITRAGVSLLSTWLNPHHQPQPWPGPWIPASQCSVVHLWKMWGGRQKYYTKKEVRHHVLLLSFLRRGVVRQPTVSTYLSIYPSIYHLRASLSRSN